jgi:D-alanyl-D-alanine carboxypeptidase
LNVHKYSEYIGTLGTTANLEEGMKVSIYDCFCGMMHPSGNDCAMTFCIEFGRWIYLKDNKEKLEYAFVYPNIGFENYIAAFVLEMNRTAQSIGCSGDCCFINPHGMHDEGHQTSARDMCILMKSAMQFDLIRNVCSLKDRKTKLCTSKYKLESRYWINITQLSNHFFVGSKSGTTPSAGPCLVTQFEIGEYKTLGCLINSKDKRTR